MSSPTSSSSPLLLGVLVKSAKIQTTDNECYSYVVLKIANVKSTTSVIEGQQPSWEQEFDFDISDRSAGLEVELWECGQFCDKLLGLCYIPLNVNDDENLINGKRNDNERWIILDSQFILNHQGEIYRTCHPTGHSLLIHTYIEYPSDLTEEESRELTEKFQILDENKRQLQDDTHDQINSLFTMHLDQQPSLHYQQLSHHSHSYLSDDSDYTSDISYPINVQSNITNSSLSMPRSNIIKSPNENSSSSSISTKKPLAFVQPVMRDLHSISNSSRRINPNSSLTEQESLSYISQSRKLPMNPRTIFNTNEK